jgi:phytoene synthase
LRSIRSSTARDDRRDVQACRALLFSGTRALWAASLALPRRVRDPATVVWAFHKSLRDHVERDGAGPEHIRDLSERIAGCYAGIPEDRPVDRALSRVASGHAIPRALFDALIEGFSWGLEARRYQTLDSLLDYAVRVAGSAAIGTVLLMGVRSRQALERACDFGVAVELVHVARDVGVQARRGRLLLPVEWLEEAGVDVDLFLAHPTASPGVRAVVQRVLRAADAFFLRADPGIRALPFDCRPAVRAARYVYGALGDVIERAELDTVTRRAEVSAPRIARLAIRAIRPAGGETRSLSQSPLPAARFLVDAVTAPRGAP